MSALGVIRKHRSWFVAWVLAWTTIVVASGFVVGTLDGPSGPFTGEKIAVVGVMFGCVLAPGLAVIWLHHRMELRLGLKCRNCRNPLTLENQKVIIRVSGCCGNCGKAVTTTGQQFVLVVDGEPISDVTES